MHKIRFIALKEVYHILRDPRSLVIAIMMPLLMTFLYGYAISLDINNITLAIVNHDNSTTSKELIDDFYNSPYFSKPAEKINYLDPEKILRESGASAVLIIDRGFDVAVENKQDFQLGMLIDGSDNNLGAAVQNYSGAVINKFTLNQFPPDMELPIVKMSIRILYNPDLESSHFFVPGLIAIILIMISALLTSITIARENETGTLEQLMTVPVKSYQILLGKIIPYIVLAFIDGVLVIFFAWLLFDIPFEGSRILLVGFGLIYVATALSIGILISSLVQTQQVAMMLALTTTMLPSVMLSGFIFAIKNIPQPLQYLSYIIPARYFVNIVRGIMLKGTGVEKLAFEGLGLILLLIVFLTIATLKFNVRRGA